MQTILHRSFQLALLTGILLLSSAAHGAEDAGQPSAITIRDLVDLARERHPRRSALQAEREAARIAHAQAGVWDHPELAGDIGHKSASGSGDDGLAFSLEWMQTFPASGKMDGRREASALRLRQAELELDAFDRQLEADMTSAVREWQAAQSYSEELERYRNDIESALDGYLKREPVGAIQRAERMSVEASLLDLKAAALEARLEAERALAELNRHIGRPPGEPLMIAALPPAENIDTTRMPAFDRHPAILAVETTKDLRRIEHRQVRLENRPEWTAGPFVSREELDSEEEYTIGIAFSVPVPLWDRNRSPEAGAEAVVQQAQADLDLARRALEAEWHRLALEVRHGETLLSVYSGETFSKWREAAEWAARQFQSGAITAPLYLDAQHEFLAVAAARQKALSGLNRANAALTILSSFEE